MSLKVSYIEPTQYIRKIYIKAETQFLVDMFVENGHKRTFLETLVKDYNAKKKNNDSCSYTNSKEILWVPSIGQKIRKKIEKVNKDITFTSGMSLQSILCQNKLKLLPNSHPGVYQLDCSWEIYW